jgi:tetratricopeptide (TPR) repeat protein
LIPLTRRLTVQADYHQFYVLDSGAALDATGREDFWTREVQPGPLIRHRRALGLVLALSLFGCADSEIPTMMCQAGADAARTGDYEQAVSMISTCLTMPGLPKDERANALEARAWSYSNLKQHALAIGDEEAAHKLRPPSEYRQFINYATYLRRVGRIQDSLNAVLAAERLEAGKVSMMTQYNKGWSLLELGRHAEAVAAFTKGIPVQPDYAFVYWRRGLAHEGVGDKAQARADFEKSARLLIEKNNIAAAGELLPAMREKLRQYGIDTNLQL